MKNKQHVALMKSAMKITILSWVITILAVFSALGNHADAQASLTKKIEIGAHSKISLKDLITALSSQSGVNIIYSASAIQTDRLISIKKTSDNLEAILHSVFRPLGISYRTEGDKILLFADLQENTITGVVTNSDDDLPVVGAAVRVKGTSRGTSTGDNGQYTLTANPGEVVEVSYIGFTKYEFTVTAGRNQYNISLLATQSALEEVVVTGYSSQRVKDLTGAVAVVDVSQLQAQPAASPVEALQGKATGVHIVNDGAPGSTPMIRVRGFSTINNNDPLFVIDGMPYEGNLSWLNSSDIESMQVLKDASAASIYGARANNGVVIITTKKGTKGAAPRLTFDAYYGSQNPRSEAFPAMMNPQQYAEHLFRSYSNAGITPGTPETTGSNYGSGTTPTLPEYLVAGTVTGQNITAAEADMARYNYSRDGQTFYQITRANQAGTNWFDEITTNAPIQNYNLSIMGGGDASSYAISGGYMDQQGIVKHTGYERFNVRANTTFNFLDNKVRIGENIQYSYEEFFGVGANPNVAGEYQGEGSPLGFAYRIPTIIPVYDEGGNFAGSRGDKLGNAQNPMAILYRSKDNINRRNFFFGNAFAEADLLDGLTLKTNFGLRYTNYNGISIGYPNLEFAEGSNANSLNEYQGYTTDWTWTNTLTYNKVFNDVHRLGVMAGTEAISSNNRQLEAGRNEFFILGNMDYYYLSRGSANISNNSFGGVWAMFSMFARADYSFSDKYVLSATVRRDGSSNFGSENQFGVFPAASAAWRVSEEDFMAGSKDWLDDLKLRVGYGVTGNQRIPAFQYMARFASSLNHSSYPIAGGGIASGVWQNAHPNVEVKWEQVSSINAGLDFTLFKGVFDGSLDWYDRTTNDMLYPVPLPAAAVGMGSSPFVNIGDMNNTGFEFGLNYHYGQLDNREFQFDLGVVFSHYRNKIVSLAPSVSEQIYGDFRSLSTSILRPGHPFASFFGYQVDGIYQSESDISNSPSYDGARVGGLKYADVSGPNGVPDGIIDPFDRTIIGSPHPDFIYSLSFNARYKNFDVLMFFNGSQGNDIYEATRYFTDFSVFDGASSTRLLDAWSPNNTTSVVPSAYRGASDFEFASSSYYVQDGSFFRMRNLQIGYTFPSAKLFNNKVRNLRLYLSGTNLFTITNYTGLDPEVSQIGSTFSALGVDLGIYPVSRQYLFGISLGL